MGRIVQTLARPEICKNGMDIVMKPPGQYIPDMPDFRNNRVIIHHWKLPSILQVCRLLAV